MHDDDYTPDERQILAALPRESAPDPRDEERIVGRLRAEGFFTPAFAASAAPSSRKRQSATMRTLMLTAAALLLLACGVLLGATLARPQVTGSACAELPNPVPSSADPSSKEPVRTAGVLWF